MKLNLVFLSVLTMASVACNKSERSSTPAENSPQSGVTRPLDAGTGNAESKGVQSGSGVRSDYKPTTGPGGIEETKEAPKPAK